MCQAGADALADRLQGLKSGPALGRMQADALGRAVIDGHEDEGRALAHGHCGRHVRAPHHIGGRGVRFSVAIDSAPVPGARMVPPGAGQRGAPPTRRPGWSAPRIHARAGAVPHAADPTPYARRVEIEWASFIASTSVGPGPPTSNWSTFA